MKTDSRYTVSVVVITRDRPVDLQRCLRAVLNSTWAEFELVVIDQSRQTTSAELVEGWALRDRRLRLVRDTGNGAARARNLGTRSTSGDIVVFTDDDCEPDPSWLGSIVEALSDDAGAGMAYGAVIPAPHDPHDGFIIGFDPPRFVRLHGKLAKLRDAGISANVAVRRTALQVTGGFDEMLGPGSYFPCAEDFDLTYRVLSNGFAVLHCPTARVVHYGLRDWRSGSGLIHRTYIAIAAAYMKHVRQRDAVAVLLMLQEFGRALGTIVQAVVRRHGPFGFVRLGGLLVGIRRSFELDVDPGRRVYCPPR